MESYEIELDGKTHKVKCVKNLCGHLVDKYHIHAGKSVPIVKSDDQTKMEEVSFFIFKNLGRNLCYRDLWIYRKRLCKRRWGVFTLHERV